MADSVRRVLEQMVPELEELERRGYFSRAEIKSIIQKRQDFEYDLQRRAALKSDFMRSIEYEKSLERLRVLRKKERNIVADDRGSSKSSSEYSIVRRTHRLYERMVRKFKGDLSLWNDWIQFCSASKSARYMSKALTRAMQLHPTCAAIWTYAAAWEFEHNHNATIARSLMQRGLRMCKNDPCLWAEYFRMELLYAARLGARRQVLGLGDASLDEATKSLLSGAIAKIVYANAIESRPDDSAMRVKFLDVLAPVPIMNKSGLEEYITANILENFADDPYVLYTLSLNRFEKVHQQGDVSLEDAAEQAMDIFNNLYDSSWQDVEQEKKEEIYKAQIDVLEKILVQAVEDEESHGQGIEYVCDECINLGRKAREDGVFHEKIITCVERAYLRTGQYQEGLKYIEQSSCLAGEVHRQKIHLELYQSHVSQKNSQADEQSKLLFDADASVWFAAIECCSSEESLISLGDGFISSQLASVTCAEDSDRGIVASCITSNLWLRIGIESARKFYTQVLKCPLPGANFITHVARLEQSLLHSNSSDALSIDAVRQIYTSGTNIYGSSSIKLWLDYYLFEVSLGNRGNCGMVHWKAKESLDDADAFITECHMTVENMSLTKW
ncbi:hypothetical protein M9434_006861 [Picochlorum sp. BPE23]|nr:hypothetical protein M9434_006861 [Picochlorum sp. BPE23]